MMTWAERLKVALLAYRAYNGDVKAGVDAFKILREKNKGVQLLTQRIPDPDKALDALRRQGAL